MSVRVSDSPLFRDVVREHAVMLVRTGRTILRRSSIPGHYAATYNDYIGRTGITHILLREVPTGIAAVNDATGPPMYIFREFAELYLYLQVNLDVDFPVEPTDEDPS